LKKEKMQAKGIHNIFNKIITENFPSLKKVCPFRYRNVFTKIEPPRGILSLKQQPQRTEEEYSRI
jgi:hypothetical protein